MESVKLQDLHEWLHNIYFAPKRDVVYGNVITNDVTFCVLFHAALMDQSGKHDP